MLRCVKPLLIFLAAGVFPALPAQAGVVVTTAPTAPATDLLASHSVAITNFADTFRWVGNAGNDHRDVGQSFSLSATGHSVLDKITVRVREFGAAVANAEFTLEIWTFSDPFDPSGNVLVNSQSDFFPTALGGSYWTFDLENVTLANGQQYGFVLAFKNGPDSQRFVNLVEDFDNAYLGGRTVARNGAPLAWTSAFTDDLEFHLQGSSVPEPASFLLFGLGFLGLAGARRWRKLKTPLQRRPLHNHRE